MEVQQRQEIVDRVKGFRSEGLSRSTIASRLNAEKIQTPAGKPWTDVLVGAFMTREGITGEGRNSETRVSNTNRKDNIMAKTTTARKAKTSAHRRARNTAASTPEFRGEAEGARNASGLADLVVGVIESDLSREHKIAAISRFI